MDDTSLSFLRRVLELEEMLSNAPPGMVDIWSGGKDRRRTITGNREGMCRLGIEILKQASEQGMEQEKKGRTVAGVFDPRSWVQELTLHISKAPKPYPTDTRGQMRLIDYVWLGIMVGFFLTVCAGVLFSIVGVWATWKAVFGG